MRRAVLIIVVLVGVAGAIALLGRPRPLSHQLELKTYFKDARGLQAGAPVRLAGVEIGRVASVQVTPGRPDNPAEVVMEISTPYELKIPRDATVVVESEGLLGSMFAEVDIQGTSGASVGSGEVLESRSPQTVGAKEVVNAIKVVDAINKVEPCGGANAVDSSRSEPAKGTQGRVKKSASH